MRASAESSTSGSATGAARATGLFLFVTLVAVTLLAASPAAAAGTVSGKYLGNGKEAKLAFVRVIPHEGWDGEKAYTLILSAKDASKSSKPDFDAMFGELGDALVVSLTVGGDIFGIQVCHQALEKSGFSTSGTLEIDGFSIADGKLQAHFFTTEEHEFFGDKWQIDLTVEDAPLPE